MKTRGIRIILVFLITTTMLITACGPKQYSLSTSVSPDGGGTIDPATGTYDTGTEVILTAEPASGYRFDRWSGDATGTSGSVTITMDNNKSVTAHFQAQYTLNASVSPIGSGTIDPATGTYDSGTRVTLTAEPASGYRFDRWSGDATGTSSSVIITMDDDKSVTARFQAQYTLSASVSPIGSGTISPTTGTYDSGTRVTIVATPAEGYIFNRWGGDATGTSSSVTITVSSYVEIIAYFGRIAPELEILAHDMSRGPDNVLTVSGQAKNEGYFNIGRAGITIQWYDSDGNELWSEASYFYDIQPGQIIDFEFTTELLDEDIDWLPPEIRQLFISQHEQAASYEIQTEVIEY